MDPEKLVPIREVARSVLDLQDASNLSGVLKTWALMTMAIRVDCVARGVRFERHEANILMLSKVVSLMSVNANCIGCVDADSDSTESNSLVVEAFKWAKKVGGAK